MNMAASSTAAAKNTHSLSLPLKITVTVYWVLMLAGIVLAPFVLRDSERSLMRERERLADLVAYRLNRLLYENPAITVEQLRTELTALARDQGVAAVTVYHHGRTVPVGRAEHDADPIRRPLHLHHEPVAKEHAEVVLYPPNLQRAIVKQRKDVLVGMSAGFFAFGVFLTWLLRRMVTRPVIEMVGTAQAIVGGRRELRFRSERRDEFGYLAKFVNDALDQSDADRVQLERALERAHQSEAALYEEKERLRVMLSSIGDGVIATDETGAVRYINPIGETLSGWRADEARGRPIAEVLPLIDEQSREPLEAPVYACLRQGVVIELSERAVLVRRDGSEIAIADSAAPIRGHDAKAIGVVMVFRDVGRERELTQQLSYQATHDELTGLANRREFEQQLQRLVVRAQHEHSHHALCYIDLDQFKIVNDTCGHIAGDELLRQISDLLRLHVRSSDLVGRLGGDEFAVLLYGCPPERAKDIAETLRQAISAFQFIWERHRFDVGASIGLVAINDQNENMVEVLSAADVACYEAKNGGRNRVHLYQPDDQAMKERWGEIRWVSRIKNAIAENRLRLYYQPIAKAADISDVPYHEILLRMLDESGKMIPPMAFIPAAERYGLMPLIDRWVVQAVCTVLRHLPPDAVCNFTINLSAQSINEREFANFLLRTLSEREIAGHRICFEITETAALANLRQASQFIAALKKHGCRFALDDFGRGFCSFAYLKNLDVDYLKIDGSFVKDMVNSGRDRATVQAINDIGHIMGVGTIAECVEDDKTLSALNAMGVDYAQGYGIARPRPIEEMYPGGLTPENAAPLATRVHR